MARALALLTQCGIEFERSARRLLRGLRQHIGSESGGALCLWQWAGLNMTHQMKGSGRIYKNMRLQDFELRFRRPVPKTKNRRLGENGWR